MRRARVGVARSRPGQSVTLEPDDAGSAKRQRLVQPPVRDQHAHPAVLDDPGETLGRERGVERHVRPARLENPQQRHHHVERPLHQQPDEHIGPDPLPSQLGGEPAGAAVELSVGQVLLSPHHPDLV